MLSRCRPTGRRARSAGRGLPLGVRDGSVAETWTGAACPREGGGPVGFGVARGFAVVCERSPTGRPAERRPTDRSLTNLQKLGFDRWTCETRICVAARRVRRNSAMSARNGQPGENGPRRTGDYRGHRPRGDVFPVHGRLTRGRKNIFLRKTARRGLDTAETAGAPRYAGTVRPRAPTAG